MSMSSRVPRGRAAISSPAGFLPAVVFAAVVIVAAALSIVPLGAVGASTPGGSRAAAPADDPVQERIRARIEAAGVPARISAAGSPLHAGVALPAFYEGHAYRPAWVAGGRLRPAVDSLLAAVESADREGLRPADYHRRSIRRLRERLAGAGNGDPGALAELDLLLTDAFLTLGDHLADGRVDPVTLDPDWTPSHSEVDLVGALERALEEGRVRDALEGLLPAGDGYRTLRSALERYRERAARGGWPTVPEGPKLAPGDAGERVGALRARLRAAEGIAMEEGAGGAADTVFGGALEAAVREFQRRHGLEEDAVVGPATLEALNVSAGDRADQIRVALERRRWLPRSLGERHVVVDIADFRLELVQGGEVVLGSRAVVGRPYRRTPAMSDRITYLVFSPYWHVPHGLAVQDQLPLQKRDPGYFRRVGMRVFRGWGADAREVDPDTVDWSALSARDFPYRLRQDPGPQNALGGVKFMFPNRFSVYLHDTPTRGLFDRRSRAFSSGCIRVEAAAELAVRLLRGDPDWPPESVRAAMEAGSERTVRLPEPVPVHLVYRTVRIGDGGVEFRPDVYGRDGPVLAALDSAPSRVAAEPGGTISPDAAGPR